MGEENTFNVKNNIIRADVTFSLQLPKLAFLFAENTEYVGEWDLLNIGLSEEGIEETETNYEMLELEDIRSLIKPRQQFAHKGNFGHALLIAGSKGMAGAYNHNVIKIAEKEALSDNKNMLFVVGQVGRKYFEKKNIPIDIDFKYTAQNPNVNRARVISEKIVELFREKKLDEVYIVYTRMVNSVTFDAEIKQLLPLKKVKFERTDESNKYGTCSFEPSMNAVFDHIIPNYVSGFVYGALVESYCSEHNARMMAMQTATDAAKDMLRSLGIEYNRARQAAITQEITEVIAGAKAQKMKED
jgi:F-type H+-transporting ATPase subunit gamma